MYVAVITMYTRSNGKHARNALAERCEKVSALTRVAIQAFEFSHHRYFTPMTAATTTLLTNEFQLIAPYQLLCLLPAHPRLDPDSKQLELGVADIQQWAVMSMKSEMAKFQRAFVKFKKREPKE